MEKDPISVYEVVQGASADDLATKVVKKLNQGWSLIGGVSVTLNTEGYYAYFQAVGI